MAMQNWKQYLHGPFYYKKRFHEYLARYRKLRGYTQSEMAGRLEISRSTYTNYETGHRSQDLDMLQNISEVLDCSIDELFRKDKRQPLPLVCETKTFYSAEPVKKLAVGMQDFRDLLEYYGLELTPEVKGMYDGYQFGMMEVYNPWSVTCFAARKRLDPYWVNTSENSSIQHAIEQRGRSFAKEYRKLIERGTVSVSVELAACYYEPADDARDVCIPV